MKLNVQLVAQASKLVGTQLIEVAIEENCTVQAFRKHLAEQHPELEPIVENLFVALDAEYAADNDIICRDSDVACFPAVSGG